MPLFSGRLCHNRGRRSASEVDSCGQNWPTSLHDLQPVDPAATESPQLAAPQLGHLLTPGLGVNGRWSHPRRPALMAHDLAPGRFVRVQGLTARPELNGFSGTITSFDAAAGRFTVQLTTPSRRRARVRPANLHDLAHEFVGAGYCGDMASLRVGLDSTGIPIDVDDGTSTALLCAALAGHCDCLSFLISRGADLDKRVDCLTGPVDMSMVTALLGATNGGETRAVSILLEAGANPDLPTARGNTPLIVAAERNNQDIARLLLAAGASQRAQTFQGFTALMMAVVHGDASIVAALSDPVALDMQNSIGGAGQTALMRAANKCKPACVVSLIDHGANLNIQCNTGQTALMYALNGIAASPEGDATARVLIQAGAALDLQTKEGSTALMFAAESSSLATVQTLVDRGASLTLLDADGLSAIDRAEAVAKCRDDILRLLREHTAGQANAAREVGTLKSSDQPQAGVTQSQMEALLMRAEALKSTGNEKFRAGSVREALRIYKNCLAIIASITIRSVSVRKFLCATNGNVATCFLKAAKLREEQMSATEQVYCRLDLSSWNAQECEEAANAALEAAGLDVAESDGSAWQLKPLFKCAELKLRCQQPVSAQVWDTENKGMALSRLRLVKNTVV